MIDLSKQTAIVTGGSRGIGRAICLMLAQAGARIVVGYHRDQKAAEAVVREISESGGQAICEGGDLADQKQCLRLFERAQKEFGALHIVVGNAGIWKKAAIDAMTESQWQEMLRANLDTIYNTCFHAAKVYKKQQFGKLILIGSTAGQRGEAFHSHYAATKGAVMAIVKSLANELGYYNVNVNCVSPGWVLTDMTSSVFEDKTFKDTVKQSIPLRRIATPEDIAGVVVFLASQLARHVQGEIISVNGGSVLC